MQGFLDDFTKHEVEVIRRALYLQQEAHKRNGFTVLELQVAELRSKISDAILQDISELTRA